MNTNQNNWKLKTILMAADLLNLAVSEFPLSIFLDKHKFLLNLWLENPAGYQ